MRTSFPDGSAIKTDVFGLIKYEFSLFFFHSVPPSPKKKNPAESCPVRRAAAAPRPIVLRGTNNTLPVVVVCFSDVPSEEIVSRLCGTPESAVGQQFETDARPPRADREDEYKFRPENGIRSTGDIFTSFNEIRVFIAVHVAAKYGSVAFKCRNTVFSLNVTMGYVRYSTLLNINAQLSTVVNDVFFS